MAEAGRFCKVVVRNLTLNIKLCRIKLCGVVVYEHLLRGIFVARVANGPPGIPVQARFHLLLRRFVVPFRRVGRSGLSFLSSESKAVTRSKNLSDSLEKLKNTLSG